MYVGIAAILFIIIRILLKQHRLFTNLKVFQTLNIYNNVNPKQQNQRKTKKDRENLPRL